jgi:hypothetical protein
MSRTRAYRRHKLAVKKKNCTRYRIAGYWPWDGVPQDDKVIIGRVATTPVGTTPAYKKKRVDSFSDIRRKQLCAHYE